MQASINVSEQEIKKLITDLEMKQSQVFDELYNTLTHWLKPVGSITDKFHVLKKDLESMSREMSQSISSGTVNISASNSTLAYVGNQEKIAELSDKLAGRHNLRIYTYGGQHSDLRVINCREINSATDHTEKGGIFIYAHGFVLMAVVTYFNELKDALKFSDQISTVEYIEHIKRFIAAEEPRLKNPLSFHKEVSVFNGPIKELKELYLFVKGTDYIASIDLDSIKLINALINN